jgi:hypothetical protein
MKRILTKFAATAAFAFAVTAMAGAQSQSSLAAPSLVAPSQPITSAGLEMNRSMTPGFTFSKSTDHQTWHTVLLVSAIFLFAGLVDSNSTLIILGGAGVLVSLSETNGNAYRFQPGRSMELARMGHMSLGINPLGQMGWSQGISAPKPSIILQAKFKF